MKLIVEKYSPVEWDNERVDGFIEHALEVLEDAGTSNTFIQLHIHSARTKMFEAKAEYIENMRASQVLLKDLNNSSILGVQDPGRGIKSKYILVKANQGDEVCSISRDKPPYIMSMVSFMQTYRDLPYNVTLHLADSMKEAMEWLHKPLKSTD